MTKRARAATAEREEAALLALARRGAETRFGREHDFARIDGAAGFRARAPTRPLADFAPWFARAKDGAANELWPGRPIGWRTLPGPLADEIAVPVTRASEAVRRRRARATWRACFAEIGRLRRRAGLVRIEGPAPDRGRDPLRPSWQWLARPFRVDLSLADEGGLADVARVLARRDLAALSAHPAWLLLLIDSVERLAQRPVREVWPSWRACFSGGAPLAPYRAVLEHRAGAGLAFFDTSVGARGLLPLVPASGAADAFSFAAVGAVAELEAPDGARCFWPEAEPGVVYRIVLTTPAGLWAAATGDRVRRLRNDPAAFALLPGRRLDAGGAGVWSADLAAALAEASLRHAADVADFVVCFAPPERGRVVGRLVWHVAFAGMPPDLAAFAAALDDELSARHEGFAVHRRHERPVGPSLVRLVARDVFAAWRRARGSTTARLCRPSAAAALLSLANRAE